ncbi:MAG: WD40 repeat domain-containing protein [Sulfuriferula sp.]
MKSKLSILSVFSLAVQVLIALIALQLPVTGYCDTGSGWIKNLFDSKGKNMKDVAVKVAELPEPLEPYLIGVGGLDFSADGKQLATTLVMGRKIHIWDWRSGHIVHTLEKAQGANDGMVTERIRYSPDGHLLVSCGDNDIRIWNTENWAVIRDITHPGFVCSAIGFTPDGKSLIAVNQNGVKHNLAIYDTTSWQIVWGLGTTPFYPSTLSISPDGKFVAIGGYLYDLSPTASGLSVVEATQAMFKRKIQHQIVIVDLAQRKIINIIPNTVNFSGPLVWNPDGVHIATMGTVGEIDTVMVVVFDTQTGKQAAITDEQLVGGGHSSLCYTPDGKYLIEGDMDGLGNGLGVKIWDGQHRKLLQEIPGNVRSLAVSRDGHYFAMGIDKKTIVWQLK